MVTRFFFILFCIFQKRTSGSVQVANVTRAGCEKASTGQFELLRWLLCLSSICIFLYFLLKNILLICIFFGLYLYLDIFVFVPLPILYLLRVLGQGSFGKVFLVRKVQVSLRLSFKSFTDQVKSIDNLKLHPTIEFISARARTLGRCMQWKSWRRQLWRYVHRLMKKKFIDWWKNELILKTPVTKLSVFF